MGNQIGNLFGRIPENLPGELFTVLAENENARIERIVSDGHASPEGFWYDQEQDEWVLMVSGSAVLAIEYETGIERVELARRSFMLVPLTECEGYGALAQWVTRPTMRAKV